MWQERCPRCGWRMMVWILDMTGNAATNGERLFWTCGHCEQCGYRFTVQHQRSLRDSITSVGSTIPLMVTKLNG